MALPINLIVGLATLAGGSLAAIFLKKKAEEPLKVDSVIKDSEDNAISDKENLQHLCLLVYDKQQSIINDVKSFFDEVHYNNVVTNITNDNGYVEADISDENTAELIDSLTEYVTLIVKLQGCFQSHSSMFRQEYYKSPYVKWNDWNSHLKLLFRDIAILSDYILEICAAFTSEQYSSEIVSMRNNQIQAILEQYSNE